jgi:hypothetical protein
MFRLIWITSVAGRPNTPRSLLGNHVPDCRLSLSGILGSVAGALATLSILIEHHGPGNDESESMSRTAGTIVASLKSNSVRAPATQPRTAGPPVAIAIIPAPGTGGPAAQWHTIQVNSPVAPGGLTMKLSSGDFAECQ